MDNIAREKKFFSKKEDTPKPETKRMSKSLVSCGLLASGKGASRGNLGPLLWDREPRLRGQTRKATKKKGSKSTCKF